MKVLEFVIKLNDEQIGLLKFNDAKHSRDEAMRMLDWYVSQELSPDPKRHNPNNLIAVGPQQAPEVSQKPAPLASTSGDVSRDKLTNTHNYLLINPRARNREHAAKFSRKILNGNTVATLVALSKVGGEMDEARDLLAILRDDVRFNTSSADEGVSNIRHSLITLADAGLVERLDGGAHTITAIGSQVSKDFDVPPKKELKELFTSS